MVREEWNENQENLVSRKPETEASNAAVKSKNGDDEKRKRSLSLESYWWVLKEFF